MQAELGAMRGQRAVLEAALAADRAAQAGQTAEALTEASAEAFLAKVRLLGPGSEIYTLFFPSLEGVRACAPWKRHLHFLCEATQTGAFTGRLEAEIPNQMTYFLF